jgi:hypothetical protein
MTILPRKHGSVKTSGAGPAPKKVKRLWRHVIILGHIIVFQNRIRHGRTVAQFLLYDALSGQPVVEIMPWLLATELIEFIGFAGHALIPFVLSQVELRWDGGHVLLRLWSHDVLIFVYKTNSD